MLSHIQHQVHPAPISPLWLPSGHQGYVSSYSHETGGSEILYLKYGIKLFPSVWWDLSYPGPKAVGALNNILFAQRRSTLRKCKESGYPPLSHGDVHGWIPKEGGRENECGLDKQQCIPLRCLLLLLICLIQIQSSDQKKSNSLLLGKKGIILMDSNSVNYVWIGN